MPGSYAKWLDRGAGEAEDEDAKYAALSPEEIRERVEATCVHNTLTLTRCYTGILLVYAGCSLRGGGQGLEGELLGCF